MRIQPECFPCILNMTVSSLRLLSLDELLIRKFIADVLTIPAMTDSGWNRTSPELIEEVMIRLSKALNDPNPFRNEKKRQNALLLKSYPVLKNRIETSKNPFLTAVQMAVLGNAVDFMMALNPADVESFLFHKLSSPIPEEPVDALRSRLARSRFVVYFADNCGEIILDRLLIETIQKEFRPEIALVVRSVPTLNDATLAEVREIGLDQGVALLENGIEGPFPGTLLNRCSPQVQALVNHADLILSKGGGNFDTLGEETGVLGKIVFMLLSKCRPYIRRFKVALHDPVLYSMPSMD